MAFAEYEARLTEHAHKQYSIRVKSISKEDLQSLLTQQLASGDYHRKKEFIKLDGVWWVFEIQEGIMVFITCYGQTHIHVPSAVKWARMHNDRIDLTGGEVLCDGKR